MKKENQNIIILRSLLWASPPFSKKQKQNTQLHSVCLYIFYITVHRGQPRWQGLEYIEIAWQHSSYAPPNTAVTHNTSKQANTHYMQ